MTKSKISEIFMTLMKKNSLSSPIIRLLFTIARYN